MSGAFPAEYANALGSVFDLRLRKGNDEKHEFLTQVGFNGVEVGPEGLTAKSKASYLLNCRYSLFGIMSNLGFDIAGTPYYRDFTFKTDVPVGKKGQLTFWTLAGKKQHYVFGKTWTRRKGMLTVTKIPTPACVLKRALRRCRTSTVLRTKPLEK